MSSPTYWTTPVTAPDGEVACTATAPQGPWMALVMGDYWMEPIWGDTVAAIPPKTQFLIAGNPEGGWTLWLPLIARDLAFTLEGSASGLRVRWTGGLPGQESFVAEALACAQGSDPYRLVEDTMAALAARLGTFRLRRDKPVPAALDEWGWCTWDAFYQSVDEAKFLNGLQTWQDVGLPPGFVILDDGWLDIKPRDWLRGFDADKVKFPNGLAGVVRTAKRDYGVRIFGLWHAFQGYWAGLDPESELGRRYRLLSHRQCIRPWEPGPPVIDLHLVDPEDATSFFNDWHTELKKAGVDLVKVDGQSATHLFTEGQRGRVSAMQRLQGGLQASAYLRFGNQLISCMCNGNDILFNLAGGNWWRNSTDYFPSRHLGVQAVGSTETPEERPRSVQQRHLIHNVLNNLFSGTFAYPDWDMFQTHQPEAWYHAVARAVSGGPVYCCDTPGMQRVELLQALIDGAGRVLRCPQPAVPLEHCILQDAYRSPRLLAAYNHSAGIALVGLFHATPRPDGASQPAPAIADALAPADLPGAPEVDHAVWSWREQRLERRAYREARPVCLEEMEAEALVFAPIVRGLSPIGLVEKVAAPAAIVRQAWITPRTWQATVRRGGVFLLFAQNLPQEIHVDGSFVGAAYEPATQALKIDLSGTGEATVVITVR